MNVISVDDFIEQHWKRLLPAMKERWPDILPTEFDLINAQAPRLVGVLQEHYWITKEEAEEQVRAFVDERNPA